MGKLVVQIYILLLTIWFDLFWIAVIFLGNVKKLGMMKIVHEKYKTTTKRNIDPCIAEFKNSFNNASESNKEIAGLVEKTQEILNPLKVLQIFQNILDEVCCFKFKFIRYMCDKNLNHQRVLNKQSTPFCLEFYSPLHCTVCPVWW